MAGSNMSTSSFLVHIFLSLGAFAVVSARGALRGAESSEVGEYIIDAMDDAASYSSHHAKVEEGSASVASETLQCFDECQQRSTKQWHDPCKNLYRSFSFEKAMEAKRACRKESKAKTACARKCSQQQLQKEKVVSK